MRNMVFTKVEQITMIANDSFLWVRGWWKTSFWMNLFTFFFIFFFTSDLCLEQASHIFFFFIQNLPCKKKIWESPSKGQHLCIWEGLAKEPRRWWTTAGKKNSKHSGRGVWNQILVLFLETSHTFGRRKENWSAVVDWFVLLGGGISALSPGFLWPVRRSCRVPRWQRRAQLEDRVVPAGQHTNTLVRL